MHTQLLLLLYYLLPFIKHFPVSQGQCFDTGDFTFDDYKDSVPFTEVISRLSKGLNANSLVFQVSKACNGVWNII